MRRHRVPNIKSAKLRVKKSQVRNERNKALRTFIRHLRRDTMAAFTKNTLSLEEAQKALNTFKSEIDKAWTKGILPRNTSSRVKSSMELLFKKIYTSS